MLYSFIVSLTVVLLLISSVEGLQLASRGTLSKINTLGGHSYSFTQNKLRITPELEKLSNFKLLSTAAAAGDEPEQAKVDLSARTTARKTGMSFYHSAEKFITS